MQIINRYKKYFILSFALMLLVLFVVMYFKETKLASPLNTFAEEISLEKTTTKCISTNDKTFFVDVKGAVKNPGVYEFNDGDKIIDAIVKAGGLAKNAVTSNINLSKKLTSEMVVYIFTKSELTTKKVDTTTKNEVSSQTYTTTKVTPNNTYIPNSDCTCETIEVNNGIDEINDNISNSKININTANIEELTKLTGIGQSKAEAIITYRNNNGYFKTIEDIKNVSGLGEALFEKIKYSITV